MEMASVCLIVSPPLLFVYRGGGNKFEKPQITWWKASLLNILFWLQILSEQNVHGFPPLPFCVRFFFYVFEYVVIEDYNSPLCVQPSPSPFLVIYKRKNLMFSIVWCKTTIADDMFPSSL